jgi:hypothetical protein
MIITIAGCVSVACFNETKNVLPDSRFHLSSLVEEAAMVEINQILASMVKTIQSRRFPADSEIASTLGLDLSRATVTTTKSGVVSILGAHLPASTIEVGVVGASTPRKTLDFVFLDSAIPVGPYIAERLGAGQHIEQSEHSNGLTIAFSIDGIDCGITASARDGVIETLFCAVQSAPASSK